MLFTFLQVKILHVMISSHTVILIAVVSAYQFGAFSLNEVKIALLSAGYVFGRLLAANNTSQ